MYTLSFTAAKELITISILHMGKLRHKEVMQLVQRADFKPGLIYMLPLSADEMNAKFSWRHELPHLGIQTAYPQRWPPPTSKCSLLTSSRPVGWSKQRMLRHFCGWTVWYFTEATCLFSSSSVTEKQPTALHRYPHVVTWEVSCRIVIVGATQKG